jgi:hypothetical protein
MENTNHIHKIQPIEGKLLSREELEIRNLRGMFYVSGVCTECGYQEVTAIAAQPERRKSRLGIRTKQI